MLVVRGVDELRRDAHAIVDAAHAAFDEVAASELARDRTGVDIASFVCERRWRDMTFSPAIV